MEEKSNNADFQKRSVMSYAAKVFQESTIGMVSSIVSTHSKYRRVFKTLLFLMCISGFLYQCITFLNHVFTYPTTVDIDIEKPDTYDIPAYTFCTNNPIKRSLFCSMYSDHCYKPTKEFCKKFYNYCGTNETLIPKKEYYELENLMTHEEILDYGNDLEEFFVEDRNRISYNERPSGPYLRTKRGIKGAMICYSLHSVIENNEQPFQTGKSDRFDKPPIDTLVFYIDESEMFIPGNRPGVLFSIHSPYEAVNPFVKGIFMKPGRTYKIYVEMDNLCESDINLCKTSDDFVCKFQKQEILLKDPFETDCENYEETWEKNNYTGPRIQEMCQHKCILDFSLAHFNCVHPFILYPSEGRICDKNDTIGVKPSKERWYTLNMCWKNCHDDCKATQYIPQLLERYEVDYSEDETLKDYHRYITVEVYLKDTEVMILKHSPKYMTVEVFSNIGGFIGCWLGIALMDIIDFWASVFTVCRYAFKKKFRMS